MPPGRLIYSGSPACYILRVPLTYNGGNGACRRGISNSHLPGCKHACAIINDCLCLACACKDGRNRLLPGHGRPLCKVVCAVGNLDINKPVHRLKIVINPYIKHLYICPYMPCKHIDSSPTHKEVMYHLKGNLPGKGADTLLCNSVITGKDKHSLIR